MAKAKKPAAKKAKPSNPVMLGDDVKPTPINKILKARKADKNPKPGFTVKDKIKAREAK